MLVAASVRLHINMQFYQGGLSRIGWFTVNEQLATPHGQTQQLPVNGIEYHVTRSRDRVSWVVVHPTRDAVLS